MDVMNDWWIAGIAFLAMVVSGVSVLICRRLARTRSASTAFDGQALEECHRLAVAALDVSNDLGTQVAELKRLWVQQHDNEPMKAELSARIRRESLKGETSDAAFAWFFRVDNHGSATAKNMKLLIDGKTAHEHPALFPPAQEPTALAPQDCIEYPLAVPSVPEQRRPLNVRITWADDSRANRVDEFTLTAE